MVLRTKWCSQCKMTWAIFIYNCLLDIFVIRCIITFDFSSLWNFSHRESPKERPECLGRNRRNPQNTASQNCRILRPRTWNYPTSFLRNDQLQGFLRLHLMWFPRRAYSVITGHNLSQTLVRPRFHPSLANFLASISIEYSPRSGFVVSSH